MWFSERNGQATQISIRLVRYLKKSRGYNGWYTDNKDKHACLNNKTYNEWHLMTKIELTFGVI